MGNSVSLIIGGFTVAIICVGTAAVLLEQINQRLGKILVVLTGEKSKTQACGWNYDDIKNLQRTWPDRPMNVPNRFLTMDDAENPSKASKILTNKSDGILDTSLSPV